MKTPISKFVSAILFVIVIFTGSNGYANILKDTAKIGISLITDRNTHLISATRSNVIYPSIFIGHESQTLEYIERFSINRRAYLLRTFNKGKKYFPQITAIFEKYNLPQEFKVLIALESGFNGNAVSPAGAVGFWQIMDPVAREYGLKIAERVTKVKKTAKKEKKGTVIDERKNFNKSTYAAARYLKDRCRNLHNDYLLIVASYNWGVGNVWNAMQRTGKAAPTFWDIKKFLPAETKAYVMNFIAMNVIFHNYEKFAGNKLTFQSDSGEMVEVGDNCNAFIGPAPHLESSF